VARSSTVRRSEKRVYAREDSTRLWEHRTPRNHLNENALNFAGVQLLLHRNK
jgi:hypothetical protein